jgi:hypothetical protein
MTRVRRLIRRHIAVLAVAALGAAVLAVPAGARTALEPGQPVAASHQVSLRLADKSSPPVGQIQQAVTPRPPVFASSTTPVAAPRAVPAPSDSDISGLAFILSLVGVAIVAAGGAAVVTSRVQRGGHSTA